MRVQFKIVWQEYKMTCLVQERTRDFVAANDVMLDREWLPRGDAQAKNGLGLQGGTLAGKHNTDFPLRHPRSSHPRTEACFAKANKRTHLLCHRMSSVLLNEANLFSEWLVSVYLASLRSDQFLSSIKHLPHYCWIFWNRLPCPPIKRF